VCLHVKLRERVCVCVLACVRESSSVCDSALHSRRVEALVLLDDAVRLVLSTI
jgi:hypothetical protein